MHRRTCTALLLPLIAVSFSFAQPKITVDKEKIDLGVLYNGAVKGAEIKLTNTGNDTLKIMGVQSSCGCTTVKHPKSALAPGESDIIKVEFNSTGFYGPATKLVNITSNDPNRTYVTVTLTAEVRNELEPVTKSSVLWIGTVPVGKSASQELTFKNLSGRTLTIKNVVSKNPSITVKPESTSVPPSGELKVSITIQSKQEGYVGEEVFLETDSKNQPRVPLRVSFVGVKPS
ncbi:MAG TPA: DUF1573 domain-containing protein [Bacteroidota bacterium]|nr:DUF1573 domain-containing protein [Bacteroidota bacterium]